MKAWTNIFHKIMSSTELQSVHTNVKGKNTRDPKPLLKRDPNLLKEATLQERVICRFLLTATT